MPELRWTLLIIGVLFIAILAWWERRRPHQAPRNDPSWGLDGDSGSPRPAPHVNREPILTLPEIRTEVRAREPVVPRELPIVEIADEIEAEAEEEISEELDEISGEISKGASEELAEQVSHRADEEAEELEDDLEEEERDEREEERQEREQEREEREEGSAVGAQTRGEAVEAKTAGELPPPVLNTTKPIVDWPPEDQRKLVSLRLVARPPERFRGSLVRQALSAEGFVLGDLDIFHKPDQQNRAVLSAASLTKPGTFDLETMDTQRYVGLNLFAVLPGPKSPRKAFEDLLITARMLNERLEGALQDDRGGPLTPMRIQALRDGLEADVK